MEVERSVSVTLKLDDKESKLLWHVAGYTSNSEDGREPTLTTNFYGRDYKLRDEVRNFLHNLYNALKAQGVKE